MSKSKNRRDIEPRKGDHIRLSLDQRSQSETSVFDNYRLPYSAVPELSLGKVDTSTEFLDKDLAAPILIGSMTGGSEHGRTINTNLAIAAEHCGVAMGVGSQRIGLEKVNAKSTFKLVRKNAPNAVILANMGAVQLNYGHSIPSYKKVVEMVEANALILHLNPLQEAIQPGGDTDFSGLLKKIKKLVSELEVPVVVKEVGHGISRAAAEQLYDVGVYGIDVAGVGGTSYAWIESERAKNDQFAEWFKELGIPTDQAVQEVAEVKSPRQLLIASGGVRSPIDGLKCRAMGADLFSASQPFLAPAMKKDPDNLVEMIENWKAGLRVAMFACGVSSWKQAEAVELVRKGIE